jgi:hypothetical protein
VFKFNPKKEWVLYTDASGLSTGSVLEIGGVVVEDACKLRGVNDKRHINIAELDGAVRGLLLVAKYFESEKYMEDKDENGYVKTPKKLQMFVDSKVVLAWLTRNQGAHFVQAKGINQVVVEHELDLFWKTAKIMNLEITIEYVRSAENKADLLTRVPDCLQLGHGSLYVDFAISTQGGRHDLLEELQATLEGNHLGDSADGIPDAVHALATISTGEQKRRDDWGRVIVEDEQELGSGLKAEERGLEITEAMGAGAWAVPSAPT